MLLGALAFGTSLTLLATGGLRQAETLRLDERRAQATQAVVGALQLQLTRTKEAIRNAALMIESHPQLTNDAFDRYMRQLVEHELSVNLVEWQPIVPATQLGAFEAAARAAGQRAYRVVQPDADGSGREPVRGRDEYVPVLYAWPQSYQTAGLDMSFSPERMASKLASRSSAQPVASGPFEFMKEGVVKSGSTAMALSTTVFNADRSARGYLAAVVDLPTLFGPARLQAQTNKLDLQVFDAGATNASPPIYAWQDADPGLQPGRSARPQTGPEALEDTLAFAGQQWRIVLLPHPGFYDSVQTNNSRLAQAGGLAMTLTITLALHALQRSRRKIRHAESMANRDRDALEIQTRKLEEAQRIAHLANWRLDVASDAVQASQEWCRMLGLPTDVVPPSFNAHRMFFTPESWDRLSTAVKQSVDKGAPCELELELAVPAPDGSPAWMWMRGEALQDDSRTVVAVQGVAMDITRRKRAELEVNDLAHYDTLTHLPNRRLLMERLTRAIAYSSRHQKHGAVLFIDLDNFKTINDTLGHPSGDSLLQQVARRLLTTVRDNDTVARLGGDEFVVILQDLDEIAEQAAKQAEAVGEKILALLNKPHGLNAGLHHCTPSIGVTLFAHPTDSPQELLQRADVAMYRAKTAGRNTLRFFDHEMQAAILKRAASVTDLREAIQADALVLYFQAQVDEAGRPIGAEALVRLRHPQRGIIEPAEFIALAEETGLIFTLGAWVLKSACQQLLAWSADPNLAHLTLAVNVSPRQFQSADFVSEVLALVEQTGVDPRRLKLELTESLLLTDIADTIVKMNRLKAKGLVFSMDDFGTGYSSLAYLKRLPLDQLKIDQSFVKNILADPNDAAIARMVVLLAESMGLSVIAEGVETTAQQQRLSEIGCRAYQGYRFGRPLPAADFEALVRHGFADA